MRKTMILMVVTAFFFRLDNSQAVAQPIMQQDFDPYVGTQFVTTYDSSLKVPKVNAVSKSGRRFEKKRPAFWLDVYTAAFLSVSSILGVMLISWTVNARKVKTPTPLFEQPGYAPRISTMASKPERPHRNSSVARRSIRSKRT